MATAQINARIDADIKERGDRALSSIGYSPTRIIRAVWEFAGRNANDRKTLRAWVDSLENELTVAQRDAEIEAWEKKLAEGPRIIERAYQEMGIEHPRPLNMTDEELLEEELLEKMMERGLWNDPE